MEDLVGGHYWIGSGCFIDGTAFQLVESPAPGIIDEQSICEPVQTGSIIYRFYDTDWMWSIQCQMDRILEISLIDHHIM